MLVGNIFSPITLSIRQKTKWKTLKRKRSANHTQSSEMMSEAAKITKQLTNVINGKVEQEVIKHLSDDWVVQASIYA